MMMKLVRIEGSASQLISQIQIKFTEMTIVIFLSVLLELLLV